MGKIIDPHIQWEYTIINISKEGDITESLNQLGKNGWECFYINVTVFGSIAYMKRVNYSAMETKRLKSIAEVTNTAIDKVMKSELLSLTQCRTSI